MHNKLSSRNILKFIAVTTAFTVLLVTYSSCSREDESPAENFLKVGDQQYVLEKAYLSFREFTDEGLILYRLILCSIDVVIDEQSGAFVTADENGVLITFDVYVPSDFITDINGDGVINEIDLNTGNVNLPTGVYHHGTMMDTFTFTAGWYSTDGKQHYWAMTFGAVEVKKSGASHEIVIDCEDQGNNLRVTGYFSGALKPIL